MGLREPFPPWILAAGAATLLLAGFIAIPIAALLFQVRPEMLVYGIFDPQVIEALTLSLVTGTISTAIIILIGTPVSFLQAKVRYRGREVLDTLLELPLVLPPAVAGLALLLAFGRRGLLGGVLEVIGISVSFTTLAVVMAQIFVASPFYLKSARNSFSLVNSRVEQAARTLGASPFSVFMTVTVPLSAQGLAAGAVMTFARAIGEFGATIMFAGNLPGKTQTMSLAIYSALQGGMDPALVLSVILVFTSFGVILMMKYLIGRGTWD